MGALGTFIFMMLLLILLVIGLSNYISVSSPTIARMRSLIRRYDVFLSFRGPDVRRGFVVMLLAMLLAILPVVGLSNYISVSSPTIARIRSPICRYDVFLSFRGPDVRRGFVDHLYNALTSEGIYVFLDSHALNKGEDISTSLKRAIESSRIRIPIFSPDFANSVWCLNEILLIARQNHGMTIPLFYKIAPSHVRHPERPGSPFWEPFQHYQSRQEINEWKDALYNVSCLSGWSLDDTNGYEAALVKRVVQDVHNLSKRRGRWGFIN